MDSKILLDHNPEHLENMDSSKTENKVKPNLFQGRTEAVTKNAKFPDWDIVPPNQFINPRVKKQ